MHEDVLGILRCPCCSKNMIAEAVTLEDDEIMTGSLRCQKGKIWSISEGVVDLGSEEQKDANKWSEELKDRTIEELDQEIKNKTPANQLELQEQTCQRIVQHVVCNAPRFVLDVGTGRGTLLKELAPKIPSGCHMTCVDLSSAVLKAVRKKIKQMNPRAKVDYIACDASSLPFNNESFDMVISFFGVSNMGDSIPKGITEIRRVLRQSGSFVNSSLVVEQNSKSYQMLQKHYGEKVGSLVDFITLKGFREIHNRFGFADVRLDMIGKSLAEKNELDLLPVEGDCFALVLAVAQKQRVSP